MRAASPPPVSQPSERKHVTVTFGSAGSVIETRTPEIKSSSGLLDPLTRQKIPVSNVIRWADARSSCTRVSEARAWTCRSDWDIQSLTLFVFSGGVTRDAGDRC